MTISMDPPSGKIYDPAEMWGDPQENRRQMEEWMKRNPGEADKVRKELAEQERKYKPKPSSSPAIIPPAPLSAPAPSHLWQWLLALLLVLAAGGTLLWKRMRR